MRRHYSAIIAVCDRTCRASIPYRLVVAMPFLVLLVLLVLLPLQSSVLLALNRPKSVPLTPKTPLFAIFPKKSLLISCLFGKRLYLCTRFRKRRRIKSRSLTDCDTRQGSMADVFFRQTEKKKQRQPL